MIYRIRLQYLFGMVVILALGACSSDTEPTADHTMQPLVISSVTYTPWGNSITRSAVDLDASSKEIWVSANDATPSLYVKSAVTDVTDPTYNKYVVKVDEDNPQSPQEWNGIIADVYGFYTSTNANRVNTPFSVAVEQNGTQSYDFQASEKSRFSYSTKNSDGVTLRLRQQLARVSVIVEDADAHTQVLMGNGQLYCSGMFNYPALVPYNYSDNTTHDVSSPGYWTYTGNRQTMVLTDLDGDKTFSAYILPQTLPSLSHFFRVYNTATGRSAYYALPDNTPALLAGHEYTCTLLQNVNVASIQVDEDFSNNSGDTKEINTVASN